MVNCLHVRKGVGRGGRGGALVSGVSTPWAERPLTEAGAPAKQECRER